MRITRDSQEFQVTDLGLFPNDWEISKLKDLSSFITKGYTPTTYGHNWQSNGVLFLRSECVSPNGLDLSESMFISEEAHNQFNRSEVKDGDILITITGNVGRSIILKGIEKANINQHIARIRVSKNNVDPTYVYHHLNYENHKKRFNNITTGQAYPQISLEQVREAPILLPSFKEQKAISTALSDTDRLIESLDKLIAKKRAIKEATMQELLTGKTRLPGFEGEWETKKLGDVAEIKSGATPSTQVPDYWSGEIPWCTPTDITSTPKKYLSKTERNITDFGLASCSAILLPPGSLLLCSRATIGEVKIAANEMCTNQGFKSLVCHGNVHNEFLYYLILTLKPKMIERAIGSTFLEIDRSNLSLIKITIPPIQEQYAIAATLSDMDNEIEFLEKRREKTKQIKQGMMQELLSGRTRLTRAPEEEQDLRSIEPSWETREAVILGVLADELGKEDYPLGRFRRQKFAYLLHRHTDQDIEGFLKKAAGPYDPRIRYDGPEQYALERSFVEEIQTEEERKGFVAGEKVEEAKSQFQKWYGEEALKWLVQFEYNKDDTLELWTTVDMAMLELKREGRRISVENVKQVLRDNKDWQEKLGRDLFSDRNIRKAIYSVKRIFRDH